MSFKLNRPYYDMLRKNHMRIYINFLRKNRYTHKTVEHHFGSTKNVQKLFRGKQ